MGMKKGRRVFYNLHMSGTIRKTYFGHAALVMAVITDLVLGINFVVAYLNFTPGALILLNNVTAFFYCILTPLTAALGFLGLWLGNDSKTYSRIALLITAIPFLILFVQLISAIRR